MNLFSYQEDEDEELPTSPYLLHCHVCQKRLILESNLMGVRYYECPETHTQVQWFGTDIIGYTIFWDADVAANERYKMLGINNNTILYKKSIINLQNKHWGGKEVIWKPVLSMEHLFKLEIKNNMLVVNNLIARLQKLKAFT